MHYFANLCKTIHATDPILLSFLGLNITKVCVKFYLVLISCLLELVVQIDGKCKECINYAYLCKTMYATDPILLISLRLSITNVYVKFHLDQTTSFL